MTVLCTRCGNPAIPLPGGGATHPLNGHYLYPCYGNFGGVLVTWPGTHALLPREAVRT